MEKVEQPHGGALLTGGVPGNKGGGRPKDAVRARLQVSFEALADYLDTSVQVGKDLAAQYEAGEISAIDYVDRALKFADLCRALDVTGKYSIGTKQEVETVVKDPEIIVHFRDSIASRYGDQVADEILSEVESKVK